MSNRTPKKSNALRRFTVGATSIGAAVALSLAAAAPAQAKDDGGGPVTCGIGQTVTVYSTGTVGNWNHLAADGYDHVRRSGTTSTPTTVYTRTTFNSISNWRVSADDFTRAGARCQ